MALTKVNLTNTVEGTLPVANGGTGATTQAAAAANVLPTQTGNSGKYLTTNGTDTSWGTVISNPGTVTSVSGTGTVSGLSLSGTVTSSGSLTLGGSLSVSSANLPAGSVLQVLQAINNSTYTVGAGTTALTGMSITITPRNTSSKFVITFGSPIGKSGGAAFAINVFRNGTSLNQIGGGTYNGLNGGIVDAGTFATGNIHLLDSPATASAITYTIRISNDGTASIGRRPGDNYLCGSQVMQVWEIAG